MRLSKTSQFLWLCFLFMVILYLASFLQGAYEGYELFPDKKTLIVKDKKKIPISELSGLFYNHQTRDLFAVGDREASFMKINLTPQYELGQEQEFSFSDELLTRYAPCQSKHIPECQRTVRKLTSQWEAIFQISPDQVFLFHEQFSTGFLYSLTNRNILARINFDSYELSPTPQQRQKSTLDTSNALGEGLLLLSNLHFLVAKERFPASIVEFSQDQKAQPEGYRPDLRTPSQTLGTETYHPIHTWELPREFNHCDLSEVALDSKQELYLLSQECQWIGKVLPFDGQTSHISFSEIWRLPAFLKKAESFVILDETHFLVGDDHASAKKENLYLLSKPHPAPHLASQ
jgi:uncharacterized protein YjiK